MKLRKIIAAVCCGAMLLANTAISVFAVNPNNDAYSNFTIGSGDDSQLVSSGGLDDYGCAHITINKNGTLLSDITYAKFTLLVTKGAFVNEVNGDNNGISDKVGMYVGSGRNKKYIPSSNGQIAVANYDDQYDSINMNFASATGLGQDDEVITDLYFTYDGGAGKDIEVVLKEINISYDSVTKETFSGNKKYTLKADSSTVVEKTEGPGEPDAPVGPTIEETEVANDSNGRFAKGFGAKFTDVTAGGTVNVKWTLTNTDTEATDSKTIAYDTTGISGNVAVGLVINMADTNVFENITAAAEIVE